MPLRTNSDAANVDVWVRVIRLLAVGVKTSFSFTCYAAGKQLAFSNWAIMLTMLPAPTLYIVIV